jgi:predicted methyltransferase
MLKRFWLLLIALILAGPVHAATPADPLLQKALADPHRTASFAARDASRHPAEELAFFGVKPNSTVIEIWPAGGYWTEFLAPYLRDHGAYYAAVPPPGPNPSAQAVPNFWQKLAADPANYGKAQLTVFGRDHYDIVPPLPGHADFVLTFRNYHDWMRDGFGEQALRAFYKALKPGGILGVEDHRGNNSKPQDPKAAGGYVRQDYMIRQAKQAGFEFVGSSEIDANTRDTADWPEGVWSLPPTFREGEINKAQYQAIGEADNFVLKFRKPAS